MAQLGRRSGAVVSGPPKKEGKEKEDREPKKEVTKCLSMILFSVYKLLYIDLVQLFIFGPVATANILYQGFHIPSYPRYTIGPN